MNNKSKATKNNRKLTAIICASCGGIYSLRDFSREDPLEVCGECGAEYFLPYSIDCLKGYRCLEQYEGLLELLPEHLRSALPLELQPRLSPFRN